MPILQINSKVINKIINKNKKQQKPNLEIGSVITVDNRALRIMDYNGKDIQVTDGSSYFLVSKDNLINSIIKNDRKLLTVENSFFNKKSIEWINKATDLNQAIIFSSRQAGKKAKTAVPHAVVDSPDLSGLTENEAINNLRVNIEGGSGLMDQIRTTGNTIHVQYSPEYYNRMVREIESIQRGWLEIHHTDPSPYVHYGTRTIDVTSASGTDSLNIEDI